MKSKYFHTIVFVFLCLSLLLLFHIPDAAGQSQYTLQGTAYNLPIPPNLTGAGLPYLNAGFSFPGYGSISYSPVTMYPSVHTSIPTYLNFPQSFGGLSFLNLGSPVSNLSFAGLPYGFGFQYPVRPVTKPTSTQEDIDHIGQFNFKVEIEGVYVGQFKNVEGLDSETEVVEYQTVDDLIWRKRPGRVKNSNITLREGVGLDSPPAEMADQTLNDFFSQWRQDILAGIVEGKKGAVVLYNREGKEILRYNIFGAWPSKWKGFSLDGKGNDVQVEEVTLVVQEIDPEIKKYSTHNLPHPNTNYELYLGDERLAVFEDASILTEPATEVIEYKDGDPTEGIPEYISLDGVHKILGKRPGRSKYANILLKRGYLDSGVLWEWYESIAKGAVAGIHKVGSVVVSKPGSIEPLGRYNFFEAWPSKWKGFTLDGKGNDVNVEEIELAVEKIERD